jgi:hypothetical protein
VAVRDTRECEDSPSSIVGHIDDGPELYSRAMARAKGLCRVADLSPAR